MKMSKLKKIFYFAAIPLLWALIIFVFIRSNGKLTVDQLLNYTPKNMALAIPVMLGIFALRSFDFLIYIGLIYAVTGILFPVPLALAVNLLGTAILCLIPYQIGRSEGTGILEKIYAKYPKTAMLERLFHERDFLFVLSVRLLGVPVNIASLFFGARKTDKKTFLAASLLALLTDILPFTIIGSAAEDKGSFGNILCLTLRFVVFLTAVIVNAVLMRKDKKAKETVRCL